MKVLRMFAATALLMSTLGFGSAVLAYEYKFNCHSKNLDPSLEINGTFVLNEGMTGVGQVELNQSPIDADHFSEVAFYRGMWTSDRLNFYLRTATGEQRAIVIIEDFFENDPFALKTRSGVIQGEYGDSELTCFNRSCGECFNEPYPTDHCRDVCGCTSPFCGAW